jgi:hypothetical protein
MRLFWTVVLALAAYDAGKRLLWFIAEVAVETFANVYPGAWAKVEQRIHERAKR